LIIIPDSSHNHIKFPRHPANAGLKARANASPLDPSLRAILGGSPHAAAVALLREASHFHRVHPLQRQAGRCAAGKAVFDPDLEQGGNVNLVVRRDPPPAR
jgi:hypothetical protein